MKNKPMICRFESLEIGKDFILKFCENPYQCNFCTKFLHKVKTSLMTEWFVENLRMTDVFCIKMELIYSNQFDYLLTNKGLSSFMNNLHLVFSDEVKNIFHNSKFLLHNRFFIENASASVKIQFNLFFPPVNSLNEIKSDLESLIKNLNPEFSITTTLIPPHQFEPEECNPDLYDTETFDKIITKIEKEFGAISNKVETTYLYTWGGFFFNYRKKTGFKSNELLLNDINPKTLNIYVPD